MIVVAGILGALIVLVVIYVIILFKEKKRKQEFKDVVREFSADEKKRIERELKQRKKRIGYLDLSPSVNKMCVRCFFSHCRSTSKSKTTVCSVYPQARFAMHLSLLGTCDFFATKGTPKRELIRP